MALQGDLSMNKSVFFQTKCRLLELINSREVFVHGNQLYSEEELSQQLGVSRTTVREVLASLSKEGIISKKHGVGNFVHHSALGAKMRIEQTRDFAQLIEEGGYQVSTEKLDAGSFLGATAEIAQKLALVTGDRVFFSKCIFCAGQAPAIYCKIYLPAEKLLSTPSIEMEQNIFVFLKRNFDEEIAHTIVNLMSKNATASIAKMFNLQVGDALLYFEESYYNLQDEVICYSEIYFNPAIMELSMLRKSSNR